MWHKPMIQKMDTPRSLQMWHFRNIQGCPTDKNLPRLKLPKFGDSIWDKHIRALKFKTFLLREKPTNSKFEH